MTTYFRRFRSRWEYGYEFSNLLIPVGTTRTKHHADALSTSLAISLEKIPKNKSCISKPNRV